MTQCLEPGHRHKPTFTQQVWKEPRVTESAGGLDSDRIHKAVLLLPPVDPVEMPIGEATTIGRGRQRPGVSSGESQL